MENSSAPNSCLERSVFAFGALVEICKALPLSATALQMHVWSMFPALHQRWITTCTTMTTHHNAVAHHSTTGNIISLLQVET